MGVKFDNTYKISTTALYLNLGHPSLPFNLKWVVKLFISYISYCPAFSTLLYSTMFHDNFTKICTNLGVGVLFIVITFNYGILIVYKANFKEMIKKTEEDLELSRKLKAEDEMAIKEYTSKGNWASKFWILLCSLTGGIFFCKAILETFYSACVGNFTPVPIYDLTYPAYIEARKNSFHVYLTIFGFQTYYVVFSCLMYIGFNPLGPIFMMHACGQIELVIRKVKKVFSDETVDEDAINKLKDIICHIQNIYSFVDQIQETHRALYEMCIKCTAVAVPISCFGIIESYHQGSISLELISYVFACCMQCYIPCYYCEVLMSKGEDLRVAIYGCGWENLWVPKSRSIILLMLARTAKPLGIRAVFSTVCLEAFSNVRPMTQFPSAISTTSQLSPSNDKSLYTSFLKML